MGSVPVAIVALVTAIAVALRRTRWAAVSLTTSRWVYGIVFPLSLLYFPIKAGGVRPIECRWTFDFKTAALSLSNFPHMIGLAIFFVLTVAQLPNVKRANAWAFAASFVLGFAVEIAEGATGIHHCKMSDLIPDMTGACIGALVIMIVRFTVSAAGARGRTAT